MSRPPLVLPAALAGAVIVLALVGAGAPVLGAGHGVRIVDKNAGYYGESAFSPRSISIRTGDRVTWTNDSAIQHNVTFSTFGSATYMDPGTRFGHRFTTPGTYRYSCTLHGFTGTVVVTGSAITLKPTAKATAVPAASPAPTSSPSPEPSASPSAVAVAATGAPAASPGPTQSPLAPASSGDSTLPLILLFGLVAVGVVGLAAFARRRT